MAGFLKTLLKLVIALLLPLGFVIPANAVFHSPAQKECASCLAATEKAHCCQDEDSESRETPCQNNKCECPDCPFCHSIATALHGILSTTTSFPPVPGQAVFSPNAGLDSKILNVAPPLPPPRIG